jgi:hypothetical protein
MEPVIGGGVGVIFGVGLGLGVGVAVALGVGVAVGAAEGVALGPVLGGAVGPTYPFGNGKAANGVFDVRNDVTMSPLLALEVFVVS